MLDQVRLLSDPILRKKCEPVGSGFIGLDAILDRMHATMTAEKGIGLAANQIGFSLRIFILKTESGYEEFINPEMTKQEELVDFEGEGCLSIPGVSAVTKRFKRLELTWTDRQGINHSRSFEDMKAFAVQHEMDHLNGKLYIDQFGPLKRQMTVDKHRKYLRLSSRG